MVVFNEDTCPSKSKSLHESEAPRMEESIDNSSHSCLILQEINEESLDDEVQVVDEHLNSLQPNSKIVNENTDEWDQEGKIILANMEECDVSGNNPWKTVHYRTMRESNITKKVFILLLNIALQ